ncbi:MAG: DeoR/GlpR family DNA-binding transcription regulator [Oscillospiraceae bacterium]
MIASERRVYIMDKLNSSGIINLKEIARELDISEITVRRDFEKLERAGRLKRVQGGAALEDVLDSAEMTMKEKKTINYAAKREVAKAAAAHVKSGDCVFLDSGTSIAPLMEFIANMPITIVTNNELVVKNLVEPKAEIYMIGGRHLPHFSMNVGPVAQEMLAQYHFDISFFGCSSVSLDDDMIFLTDMDSMLMKRIALANSARKILLIDASKLGKRSFLKFTELRSFDHIICNTPDGIKVSDDRIDWV